MMTEDKEKLQSDNEKTLSSCVISKELLTRAGILALGHVYNGYKKPEYNSRFKNKVRELAPTCIYDYNTVYRLCSIFGIEKAKEIIDTHYDDLIHDLLTTYVGFPWSMSYNEEEAARVTLKNIDPAILELFEDLLKSSDYNSETLYWVFMAHGSGAKEIIEYAIETQLMPYQLLAYSDKKLGESAEEASGKLRVYGKGMSKEDKLPKKYRRGWKL